MKESILKLLQSVKSYYDFFIINPTAHIWMPILALVLFYLLSLFIVKVKNKKWPTTQNHHIYIALFISATITILFLISYFCFLWATTNHYSNEKTQFIDLVSLLMILIIAIGTLFVFRSKLRKEKSYYIIQRPYTRGEHEQFLYKAKSSFLKLKLLFFIPVFGFLFLFLILNKPGNLLSFIIDNSSSMDDFIEFGKSALSQTISELDGKNDVILGWFTENAPRSTLAEILAERDYKNLEGENYFFNDNQTAAEYVFNIPRTQGTPLCEEIWANYLFAKTYAEKLDYFKKVLIIMTDGEGQLLQNGMDNFLCQNEEFSEFFDEVFCINLGGDLNNVFFSTAADCGYYIEEDGRDLDNYVQSLNFILGEFKTDWSFIFLLALLYILSIFTVMLTIAK